MSVFQRSDWKSVFSINICLKVHCGVNTFTILLTKKIKILEIYETESDVIGTTSDFTTIYEEPQPFLPIRDHVPFSGASVTLPGGADQFFKLANDRRSVRMFSKKAVDFGTIEKCILAAGKKFN